MKINKIITGHLIALLICNSIAVPLSSALAETSGTADTIRTDAQIVDTNQSSPTNMSVDTGSLAESPTNSSLDVPAETPATDQTAVPDISQEAATEKDSLMQSAAAGSGAYPLDNQASINRVNLPRSNNSSGGLLYNYPIQVPSGRNNFQPDLSLDYNSQGSGQESVVGYGWDLNIPYIKRANKRGVDSLYNLNNFESYLSGELVSLSSSSPSSYISRVENGDFLKYEYSTTTNSWVAKDKKGLVYKFGQTSAARQYDPNNVLKTYKWMLEEVRDQNDNYIRYEYFKDGGQIYPSALFYTGNGSTDGIFKVSFLRGAVSGLQPFYSTGFEVRNNYRINEIDIYVSGVLSAKYPLTFSQAVSSNISQLSSITRFGLDGQGIWASLPATRFNYQYSSSTAWFNSQDWAIPVSDLRSCYVVDVNGDALADIVCNYGSIVGSYINNGSGWTQDNAWLLPVPLKGSNISGTYSYNVQATDVNGDGLTDLIFGTAVYMNNGHGWSLSPSWVSPVSFFIPGAYSAHVLAFMGDLNGDGLPDIIYQYSDSGVTHSKAYVNNGSGWVLSSNWAFPIEPNTGITVRLGSVKFMDVNNDGLSDIVQSYYFNESTGGYYVYINNGHGWVVNSNWASGLPVLYNYDGNFTDLGNQVADVNGDGLLDFVVRRIDSYCIYSNFTTQTLLNNGHGWVNAPSWSLPIALVYSNGITDAGGRVVDINGDGMADAINKNSDINIGCNVSGSLLNKGRRENIISQITYPTGGNSFISYKATPLYTQASSTLNSKLPFALDTVSQIMTSDGLGNDSTHRYSYEGGIFYYSNPFDRKFAGFSKVGGIDPVGNVSNTYYHTGSGIDNSHGEYQDDFWKMGKAYRTEIYDDSNNLFKKVINKWVSATSSTNSLSKFVKLAQTLEQDYDGNATHKDSAESYVYDDANGNQTEEVKYGVVNGNDDGTFTDSGTDLTSTQTSYAANPPLNFYLPLSEITYDQGANLIKHTRHYYDNLPLGSLVKGNQTMQEQWKSGSNYVNTQRVYNIYGLTTQDIDPRGKVTRYDYDNYNLFVATSTNPLNQSTRYLYDYLASKPTQIINSNGRTFAMTYDGFGRIKAEKQPDIANPATLVTKTVYDYFDSASSSSYVHKTNHLSAASSSDQYIYFDSLGRQIQLRQQAEASNFYSVKDFAYDIKDRLVKESLPYFAAGTALTSATTTAAMFINYSYDAMDRVTTLVNAVGATAYAHDDWKTTITDSLAHVKSLYVDAYDNLIEVDEHNGANTYVTTYQYDPFGKLTKITDALGNVRNFVYDGLGLLMTSEDLHAPSDTTFGLSTMVYDNAGNLVSRINPNGQEVGYAYDDLNRQLSEDYTGQGGIEILYSYDNCADGVGSLCVATSTGAVTKYTYNALGLVKTENKTIGTSTFTTQFDYDQQGNQTLIVYPDNAQAAYYYNGAGLVEKIQKKDVTDSQFVNVVSNFDYTPMGQVANIAYANGATTTNTYDQAHMYRLSRKLSVLPNLSKAQDLNYAYDAIGNIVSISDNSNISANKVSNYWYDDLYRLASTSDSTGFYQSYAYNPIGNITYKSDVGTYDYGGYLGNDFANPHAATNIATSTIAYDKNGNVTFDSKINYNWSYRNQLTQAAGNNSTTIYLYDHDDQRVQTNGNNELTRSPNKYYNITFGAATTTAVKNVMANGIMVADLRTSTSSVQSFAPAKVGLFSASSLIVNEHNNDQMTRSWEFPVGGTSTLLVLYADIWQDVAGVGTIATATYAGLEFSKATSTQKGGMASEVWYLSSPPIGTGTVSVVVNGTTNAVKLAVAAFTGIATSSPLFSSNTATGINTPPKITQYNKGGQQLLTDTYSRFGTSTSASLALNKLIYRDTTGSTLGFAGCRVMTGTAGTTTVIFTGVSNQNWSISGAVFNPIMIPVNLLYTSSTAYYVMADHLGGTSVVTGSDGNVVENIEYYPFGEIRADNKVGGFNEKKKFTGHEYDAETGLNYMQARYQNGNIGRFVSQDPVFNALGNEALVKSKTGMPLQKMLENPQALNAYSYSYNNPLIYRDQGGEFAFLAAPAAYLVAYAPVWVPAAITTISAAGASVASWFMGQGVGNMMEGNYQSANQSFEKAQTTLGVTAMGVGGIMAAGEAAGVSITKDNSSNNTTKSANSSRSGTISVGNKNYSLSDHSQQRMQERNISRADIQSTIRSGERFSYYHEDSWKTGYYNSESKLFVGTSKNNNVTTVINNASKNYINNLKSKQP